MCAAGDSREGGEGGEGGGARAHFQVYDAQSSHPKSVEDCQHPSADRSQACVAPHEDDSPFEDDPPLEDDSRFDDRQPPLHHHQQLFEHARA